MCSVSSHQSPQKANQVRGKLDLSNMVKPNHTKPNRTEIDNMVWFWYIPYKPNGCDFIKTVGFGYGLVYNRLTE